MPNGNNFGKDKQYGTVRLTDPFTGMGAGLRVPVSLPSSSWLPALDSADSAETVGWRGGRTRDRSSVQQAAQNRSTGRTRIGHDSPS